MNLDKITEYVSHTPSNTNPLMVKQMAREYAEHPVEELKKSGGAGHTEIEKIVVPLYGAPYNGELVGLKVTDHLKGRRCLKTEMERPTDLNVGTLLCNLTDWRVKYETVNGVTNLPVLTVSGDMLCALCPVFFGGLSEYDCLIYAYEETHDTLGMGITLKKGWFAVNSATFAMKPVDLSVTPCFDFFFHYKYEEQAYEYYSTSLETIEFIAEEKNILNDEETGDKAVCLTDIPNLNPQSIIETHRLYLWCTILHSHGKLVVIGDQDLRTVTIEAETIHPIDPKFLPGVCLPVVELTTQPTEEGATLTDAENARMDAAAESETPIVVRFDYGGASFAIQFYRVTAEGIPMYCSDIVVLGTKVLATIVKEEGWFFSVMPYA
jgi:hypothetical protein